LDRTGRISKRGDRLTRLYLFEAASVLLSVTAPPPSTKMLISTCSVHDLVPRSITSFATHPTCSALLVHPDAVKDAELHALLHRYHALLRDLHHAVETCRVWATKRITVRLIVMVQIVVHDEDHRGPDRQIAV
jgi:hypothetical protein